MSNAYQRSQALQNPETTATVLKAILDQQYGEDWLSWDPVTISLELTADFNCDLCSEAMDRICAIQTVMTSDAFFKRIDAFLGITNTINTGAPAFDSFSPSSIEEITWAIAEVAFNRELLPFSYPVKSYVKKLLKDDGYDEYNYPEVLKEMFERNPDTKEVRDAVHEPDQSDSNRTNVESYVEEQMSDMVSQFNKIVDLRGLDDLILSRGADEALSTRGV